MIYTNLTTSLQRGYNTEKSSSFRSLGVIASTLTDTIIGIIASVGAILTAGENKFLRQAALNHLESTRDIIQLPIIYAKNRNLTSEEHPPLLDEQATPLNKPSPSSKVSFSSAESKSLGILSKHVNLFFKICLANVHSTSQDNLAIKFLKDKVGVRLLFAAKLVSSIVARVADGIIGVIAGLGACLTGGQFESLNNIAIKGLQFTAIVSDIFSSFIGMLNPEAAIKEPTTFFKV